MGFRIIRHKKLFCFLSWVPFQADVKMQTFFRTYVLYVSQHRNTAVKDTFLSNFICLKKKSQYLQELGHTKMSHHSTR